MSSVKQYRKKPVVIEAVQFDGDTSKIKSFTGQNHAYSGKSITVDTLEGIMFASPGDYIIKGVKGEFYPCKPDIFEATYEAVEDSSEDLAAFYKNVMSNA